jgi:hypothetical protein
MTQLLKQAIAEAKKSPPDVKDAIASRILAELRDEEIWSEAFAKTTDEQWGRIAAGVRAEVKSGEPGDLDDLLQ